MIHKEFVSSSAFFELFVRYIKSVVLIGRVYRIVMENIHDILSSFHSRLQALEGNLGMRAIPDKDKYEEFLKYKTNQLEKIAPEIFRNAYQSWRIMPDVKTNYNGRDPVLIGHGYKNGKLIEIQIWCQPNDEFLVKLRDREISETITQIRTRDAKSIIRFLNEQFD